jgi:hypothetical protein
MVKSWEEIAKECGTAKQGIGILGLRAAGKSAFLYVIGRFAEQHELGGWHVGACTEEYLKFLATKHAELEQWQKTDPTVLLEGFVLFEINRRYRPLNERQRILKLIDCARRDASSDEIMDLIMPDQIAVVSFDVSGEMIEKALGTDVDAIPPTEHDVVNRLRAMMHKCEAFILILDSAAAGDPAHSSSLAREQWMWRRIFEQLRKIDARDHREQITRPLAIVLNKADYFGCGEASCATHDLLQLADIIKLRHSDLRAYRKRMSETRLTRMDAARQFVRAFYPEIHHYTANSDHEPIAQNAQFFAMSCWGKRPNPPSCVGADIYPTAVEEPLRWVCDEVFAARSRRTLRPLRKQQAFVGISLLVGVTLLVLLLILSYVIAWILLGTMP